METLFLHDGWTLRLPSTFPGADAIPAAVPGSAHTDLLAAGLIPDPYVGTNEDALSWMHRASWEYSLSFDAAPAADGERVELVFEGLDTVAAIALNGAPVGETANMHRAYTFDVGSLLSGDGNVLGVRFSPALEYAERVQAALGERPHTNWHPYNAVRKMACSFGWDWGPDLQTAGIWRPVSLRRWRVARFDSVRPLVWLDGTTGRVSVHVDLVRASDEPVTVTVALEGFGTTTVDAAPEGTTVVDLEVPDAPVWWPAGEGAQPLVPLTVTLATASSPASTASPASAASPTSAPPSASAASPASTDSPASSVSPGGDVLDVFERRIGFRSVRVDERDGAFTFVVNGRPLFVRGLNWIPQDHFLTRMTRDRYAEAIGWAVDAHANLLRVWGGGIYENRDFYEVCDERGVLVWQDFALACAAYAEEEPIRSEILAEARENIARLTPHPSLALWNGGNENLWGHADWGWQEKLGPLTWGAGYYYSDFPALLSALDPTRPYHPGSPSSPFGHPNSDETGTHHEWNVWNAVDYADHLRHTPRFCSEFGWQAPPNWPTLTRAVESDAPAKDQPAFLTHQKARGGTEKLDNGLAHHFEIPSDFADWHWATQLNQARATTFAIEHLRSWAPHTMGAILWQLNDCWPVTSWAVVDGDGRFKPSWYALRRAFDPVLLTFQPRDGVTHLLASGTPESIAQVRRLSFDGRVLATATVTLTASTPAPTPDGAPLTPPPDATAREPLPRDAAALASPDAAAPLSRDTAAPLSPDAARRKPFSPDTAAPLLPDAAGREPLSSGAGVPGAVSSSGVRDRAGAPDGSVEAGSPATGSGAGAPVVVGVLPAPVLNPDDPARELLVAELDGRRAFFFFAADKELAYDPNPLKVLHASSEEVTVEATALARDVVLLADRLADDAVVDDQLITLLPGERHTFTITTSARLDPARLTAPTILRTAAVTP